jgi:hypothetical protein
MLRGDRQQLQAALRNSIGRNTTGVRLPIGIVQGVIIGRGDGHRHQRQQLIPALDLAMTGQVAVLIGQQRRAAGNPERTSTGGMVLRQPIHDCARCRCCAVQDPNLCAAYPERKGLCRKIWTLVWSSRAVGARCLRGRRLDTNKDILGGAKHATGKGIPKIRIGSPGRGTRAGCGVRARRCDRRPPQAAAVEGVEDPHIDEVVVLTE